MNAHEKTSPAIQTLWAHRAALGARAPIVDAIRTDCTGICSGPVNAAGVARAQDPVS